VAGDQIVGTCAGHQIPGPSGAPAPAPPLPFAAPLLLGLAATVLIGGKPAAVVGSNGLNTPPHVGLHASDPYLTPTFQQGTVAVGSSTVLFEGKGAASATATCTCCIGGPGTITATGTPVLVGG
jgi:uncharacterized Zn-binding protein involved in type VI secretion